MASTVVLRVTRSTYSWGRKIESYCVEPTCEFLFFFISLLFLLCDEHIVTFKLNSLRICPLLIKHSAMLISLFFKNINGII